MFPGQHQFINIHTHFKPEGPGEFVVRNAFLTRRKPKAPYAMSAGLHPWFADRLSTDECALLLREKLRSENVIAVGEIGLDRVNGPEFNKQVACFEAQLQVAEEMARPVIVHAVRTYSDLIPYIKKAGVRMILHGFNGNAQQADQLTGAGAVLSFGKSLFNEKHAAVFAGLPEGSFLLETDTAAGLQVSEVYARAAAIRKASLDALKLQLFHTFAANFSG